MRRGLAVPMPAAFGGDLGVASLDDVSGHLWLPVPLHHPFAIARHSAVTKERSLDSRFEQSYVGSVKSIF